MRCDPTGKERPRKKGSRERPGPAPGVRGKKRIREVGLERHVPRPLLLVEGGEEKRCPRSPANLTRRESDRTALIREAAKKNPNEELEGERLAQLLLRRKKRERGLRSEGKGEGSGARRLRYAGCLRQKRGDQNFPGKVTVFYSGKKEKDGLVARSRSHAETALRRSPRSTTREKEKTRTRGGVEGSMDLDLSCEKREGSGTPMSVPAEGPGRKGPPVRAPDMRKFKVEETTWHVLLPRKKKKKKSAGALPTLILTCGAG